MYGIFYLHEKPIKIWDDCIFLPTWKTHKTSTIQVSVNVQSSHGSWGLRLGFLFFWRYEDICVKFWKMMSAPYPNKKDNDMSKMWLINVNLQGSLVIDVQDLPLLAGFWSSLQSGEYPGYPWRPGYPENGFEGRCRKEEAQPTLSNFRSSWLKRQS